MDLYLLPLERGGGEREKEREKTLSRNINKSFPEKAEKSSHLPKQEEQMASGEISL